MCANLSLHKILGMEGMSELIMDFFQEVGHFINEGGVVLVLGNGRWHALSSLLDAYNPCL